MKILMDPEDEYQIYLEGLLPAWWSDWLDGLTIHSVSGERTVLQGRLADQAALLGVLARIHGMNLKIIAVCRVPADVHPRKQAVSASK